MATNIVKPLISDDSTDGYEKPLNVVNDGVAAAGFYPQTGATPDQVAGIERDATGKLVLKGTALKTTANLIVPTLSDSNSVDRLTIASASSTQIIGAVTSGIPTPVIAVGNATAIEKGSATHLQEWFAGPITGTAVALVDSRGIFYGGAVSTNGLATSPVQPPTLLSTTAGAGGSFAAGTYTYQVVARDIVGTTRIGSSTGSNTRSVTVTANQKVDLTWTWPAGAVAFWVYRANAAGGSSSSTVTHNFNPDVAANNLTAVGHTAEINVDHTADSDSYTIRYRVAVTVNSGIGDTDFDDPNTATGTYVLALDSYTTSGGWIERATYSYDRTQTGSPTTGLSITGTTTSSTEYKTVTAVGLDANSKWRLRIKSATLDAGPYGTGTSSVSAHVYSTANGDSVYGLTYNVTTVTVTPGPMEFLASATSNSYTDTGGATSAGVTPPTVNTSGSVKISGGLDVEGSVAFNGGMVHGTWQTPTYGTGWGNWGDGYYADARYRKLATGVVELQGLAKYLGGGGAGTTIFTLPVGFRPLKGLIFELLTGEIRVETDGRIVRGGTLSVGSYYTLSGVSFMAEQ